MQRAGLHGLFEGLREIVSKSLAISIPSGRLPLRSQATQPMNPQTILTSYDDGNLWGEPPSNAADFDVPATKARTAVEFHQQFGDALAKKGPQLIECQVAYPKAWPTFVENIHRLR
jgi:hypothetical protein